MNVSRRFFVRGFGAFSACAVCGCATKAPQRTPVVRFGAVTDVHFADLKPDERPLGVVGQRFYRESRGKLDEAVAVFNERGLDFAIELGDFKDLSKDKTATLVHLAVIENSFAAFNGPRYHVFGNHDFDCLTQEEFASRVENNGELMTSGHYFFDVKGVRFVVLDACYDSQYRHYSRNNPWDDANVPPEELLWLDGALTSAPGPAVVFCHQRLDPSAAPGHLVKNAKAVRKALEESGKVKAVITGHQHMGGLNVVNGITYYSLRALVCGSGEKENSYAEIAVYEDGTFGVTGFRKAMTYSGNEVTECHGWETEE